MSDNEDPLIPGPSPRSEGRREKAQQRSEPTVLSSTGEGVGGCHPDSLRSRGAPGLPAGVGGPKEEGRTASLIEGMPQPQRAQMDQTALAPGVSM